MIAAVWTGGGASGAVQIGMYRALREAGITPDYHIGNSVGAINVAGVCSLSPDRVEELWRSIKTPLDIWGINWKAFLFRDDFCNTKPLNRLLARELGGVPMHTRGCVAVSDLIDNDIKYFESSGPDFLKWAEASTIVVGLQNAIEGRYADGGFKEVAPVSRAVAEGATEIYVLSASPTQKEQWKPGGWWLPNFMRAIDLMSAEIFRNDLRVCESRVKIKVIRPEFDNVGYFGFTNEKITEAINHGYAVAKRALGEK